MKIRDWYFQGWERREDEAGKKAFVYTGEYYTFPGGLRPLKAPAVGMAAALTALYLLAALFPAAGGMWRVAAIPQLLEIIPLVYLVIGAVCLLRAREPLTFRDLYASWRRMERASLWSLGFTALMVLAELVFLFLAAASVSLPRELLYLLGELCCAALSFALYRFLKRHPYIPSVSPD